MTVLVGSKWSESPTVLPENHGLLRWFHDSFHRREAAPYCNISFSLLIQIIISCNLHLKNFERLSGARATRTLEHTAQAQSHLSVYYCNVNVNCPSRERPMFICIYSCAPSLYSLYVLPSTSRAQLSVAPVLTPTTCAVSIQDCIWTFTAKSTPIIETDRL